MPAIDLRCWGVKARGGLCGPTFAAPVVARKAGRGACDGGASVWEARAHGYGPRRGRSSS